ncbi:MAG: malto-oligosyltrehalose trehalohydrolase [Thermoanaerobaculia bacterium]
MARLEERPPLGATPLDERLTLFHVWAPRASSVELHLLSPREQLLPMDREADGYWKRVAEAGPGARYLFRLDGRSDRPDPASRAQPDGVHHASSVVARDFEWSDSSWSGIPLPLAVFYELHVGTFTPEGTFEAVIPHLDRLARMGITFVELMPVAHFPGTRNWGYDGAFPWAVQSSYGGVTGLKRLVDSAHARGLAVCLDVVYNHLGPEGNYLGEFAPYFTDRYHTPWGDALNFDGPESDEVRRYFIENARMWIDEFHIDALRLDAVHAIVDESARKFLEELADEVHILSRTLHRHVFAIAESDLNDPRLIRPKAVGGYGLDAQWSDDFHHSLHTILTREGEGYYAGFGRLSDLARVYREGFVYTGQYAIHRGRRYGASPAGLPPSRFVVCSQNHDQVGNRMLGERLSSLVPFVRLKLAAAAVILSPFLPLLFMGEEYGETAPFLYFTSHSDPDLIEAVRSGRRAEFASFAWKGEAPDPQDERTFNRSTLDPGQATGEPHRTLLEFYRELLALRSKYPSLGAGDEGTIDPVPFEEKRVLQVRRSVRYDESLLLFNFSESPQTVDAIMSRGHWTKLLDSSEPRWNGDGATAEENVARDANRTLTLAPESVVVYWKAPDAHSTRIDGKE